MKKLLPLLLAALVGLSSCSKKEDAQPAAKSTGLEGRWQMVSDVRTVYTSTGAVASTTTSTMPAGMSAEITATQYIGYVGTTAAAPIQITRINPTLIQFGTGTSPSSYKTITELTANKLVWTTPVDTSTPSAYPAIFTTTYSR